MSLDMKKVERTIAALKERQFDACFVPDKKRALEKVKGMIAPGSKVASGGSMSLAQAGITDWLINDENINYIYAKGGESEREKKLLFRERFFADVFLQSANAVMTDGRIYNEDGASTRVAPMIYGPDKVIMVVGYNKIADGWGEAVARTKAAAVQNCKNLGFDTPCVNDGKCHDCRASLRGCCTTVVLNYSRVPDRITVIIVGEELGL